MHFRVAGASDIEAVARLHPESWRRSYRGAYSDAYLDGDVFADRLEVWTGRLTDPQSTSTTIVANDDDDGAIVGFAHTIFDTHPILGALLENLHVAHDEKRRGGGTRLTEASARAVLERTPPTGLYLSVLEQNTAAQAFYDERGGLCVHRKMG